MDNNLKEKIKEYVIKEMEVVNSPSTGNSLTLTELDDSFRLLFYLLEINVSYTDLDRIENVFETHISKILAENLNEFPDAIEKLAANYEAFLKKLAYLKYKETPFWDGDSRSKGLKKTMFFDLCNGKIEGEKPKIDIPEPLVDNTGVKKEILDFVRTDLRNAVHNAKTYKKTHLIPYANLVISCYLFTVIDNKLFLKKNLYPEYKYLNNIVSNNELHGLDKVYIELLGQDFSERIDIMGKQIKDEFQLLSNIEKFSYQEEEEDDDNDIYIDKISNIVRDIKHLLLIGSPGSGKSTTLKRILYSNSSKIISGNEFVKFPFYIEANEYRTDNKSFRNILDSKINSELITSLLETGKIQVLIDGINEIAPDFKASAITEIKSLISIYPNSSFVITDRKYGYNKNIGIPIFELRNLDDDQIKDFIKKNNPASFNSIWENLEDNQEMLELATNPLMLKMYLAVIRYGDIPNNRGQLYNLFINTVFIREEQKKRQTDKDLKNEILSEVAYNLRYKGFIRVEKDLFLTILKDTIRNHNYPISELVFIKEILDNNIIKESENEELSFLHETYQEFFCALFLKNNFLRNNKIIINTDDLGWLEPLLLCNDLFKTEKEQLNFFDLLFKGKNEKGEPKKLGLFIKEDYNSEINIACKIANRHKSTNNSIYKTAQSYLNNYLVLSKQYYFNYEEFPIPINRIFDAVSSLNSERLIEKLFISPFWVEQWLYCDFDEINYSNRTLGKDKQHKEKFKNLANTLIVNSTDFTPLLNIIPLSEKEHVLFKSVIGNLKNFKKNLLQSLSIKKLIEYFESISFDIDIFLIIIKQESSYISRYDFKIMDKDSNIRVLKTLAIYHHSNSEIRLLIISELISNVYKSEYYLYFAKFFFEINDTASFISLTSYIYNKGFTIINNILPFLQRIPFIALSEELQRAFVENPENTLIEYKQYESKDNKSFFVINACYLSLFQDIILKRNEILLNNLKSVIPYSYKPVLNETEVILTARSLETKEFHDFNKRGQIIYNTGKSKFRFHFFSSKLSSKGDKINFSIIPDGFIHPKINVNDELLVNDKFKMSFVSFSTKTEESLDYKIVIDKIDDEIPRNGFININKPLLDYNKPLNYHPDKLKNDFILENIRKELLFKYESDSSIVAEFIKNVGLTHLYYKELKNIFFGVIILKNRNKITVYLIQTKSFKEYNCIESELMNLEINSAVIIESNGLIVPFNYKQPFYDIGFSISEIIDVFPEKREGFIRNVNNDTLYYSDYFFHYDNCSFMPQKGELVRFIPSINPSKNYQNQPVAILISRIDRPKCIISELYSIDDINNIRGIANDLVTSEELFFSISLTAISYIKDMVNEKIEIGQLYEYSVFKEADGHYKKHIKMTKRIN